VFNIAQTAKLRSWYIHGALMDSVDFEMWSWYISAAVHRSVERLVLGEEEKLMRKLKVSKIWIPAFLLAALVAGCGDSDKGASSGNPNNPLTAPTVPPGTVTPPVGSTVVCPNTPVVTATFSKPMNPATINTATFTLADPSGASVAGTVSLDPAGLVATFTPMNALAVKTTYTATITTGAADTFGNTLATNFTWTFTTSPFNPCPPPVAGVVLGASCGYGVLAGATVTNTPTLPATTIKAVTGTADLGLSPGSSITGFALTNTYVGSGVSTGGNGIVTGTIHLTDPPPPAANTAAAAQTALNAAFNDAAGRSLNVIIVASGELGGLTLAPGLYRSGISSFAITSVDLTLDAGGDTSAVWIFQMPSSTLTVGNARKVILTGGAQPGNIFWAVGSSATIGTTADVQGNILTGSGAITLKTGATLEGRALAQIPGAVTLDSNTITVPQPCQ
jgi:Ice-binding-like/Bacterial Ig-like domain